MYKSSVTYDDTYYREEAKQLWNDVSLQDGPYKGGDLVSDDYDVEVAYTTIPFNKRTEFRLEKRKLRYWIGNRATHYIAFNKSATECVVWNDDVIRQWIDTYPVEYRKCKGWPKKDSYFLIIPLHEKSNMKFYNKIDDEWKIIK